MQLGVEGLKIIELHRIRGHAEGELGDKQPIGCFQPPMIQRYTLFLQKPSKS